MSASEPQVVRERLIEGMELLKKGAFYFIIASVFGIIAGVVVLLSVAPLLKSLKVGMLSTSYAVGTLKAMLGLLIVVLIIDFILSILAFKDIKDGAELVGSTHESLGILSTGSKLMWYGFIGLLILYPAFIAALFSVMVKVLPLIANETAANQPATAEQLLQTVGGTVVALGGLSLILVLLILAVFIGGILFGLGLTRIPKALHDLGVPVASNFDIAGILFVVGAILLLSSKTSAIGSILFLVAAFLLYKAADTEIQLLKNWHPEPESGTGGELGEGEPTI